MKYTLERDERQALLLGGPCHRVDLTAVQQQLAPTDRIELGAAERVREDVHPVQPDLAVLDARVGILQVRVVLPQRLHLRALRGRCRIPMYSRMV